MPCLLDNTKTCRQVCQLDDLRFGEVDLGEPPVSQETMAPSFVPLLPSGTVVDPLQNTPTRLSYQILFLNLLVVRLMYQLTSLPWHLVRCRLLHVT